IAQGLRSEAGSVPRVPAADIEQIVVRVLRKHDLDQAEPDRELIVRYLARAEIKSGSVRAVLNPRDSGEAQDAQEICIPWSPQALFRKRDLILPPEADRKAAKPM